MGFFGISRDIRWRIGARIGLILLSLCIGGQKGDIVGNAQMCVSLGKGKGDLGPCFIDKTMVKLKDRMTPHTINDPHLPSTAIRSDPGV